MTQDNILIRVWQRLWIGSIDVAESPRKLKENGITSILSLVQPAKFVSGTSSNNEIGGEVQPVLTNEASAHKNVILLHEEKSSGDQILKQSSRTESQNEFAPIGIVNRLVIPLIDSPNENIIRAIPEIFAFLDVNLRESTDSNVLIHCTTVAALYIMKCERKPALEALAMIQKIHPRCCPNPGFRVQMSVFEQMGYIVELHARPYRQWLLRHCRSFEEFTGASENHDLYADSSTNDGFDRNHGQDASVSKKIRCKKCRFILCTDTFLDDHSSNECQNQQSPSESIGKVDDAMNDEQSQINTDRQNEYGMLHRISQQIQSKGRWKCQHVFLEPVLWLKDELEKGELEGRLQCPRCSTKVGSYHWQGMQCSCRTWVTPAFSLMMSKVDIVSIQ